MQPKLSNTLPIFSEGFVSNPQEKDLFLHHFFYLINSSVKHTPDSYNIYIRVPDKFIWRRTRHTDKI